MCQKCKSHTFPVLTVIVIRLCSRRNVLDSLLEQTFLINSDRNQDILGKAKPLTSFLQRPLFTNRENGKFGDVSDFSCKYTHGTSTVGGRGKATVRTTVRTDITKTVRDIVTRLGSEFGSNIYDDLIFGRVLISLPSFRYR